MAAPPAREPTGGDEDPAASSPEPSGGPAGYELVAWEPVVTRPDPMTEEEQQALLDAVTDQDAPWWLEEGDPTPRTTRRRRRSGPKCRRDHRLKQHPRWKVDQLPGGTFRWTTPSGRQCTTEATRYPI
jgi:hypothetical protein